MMLIMLVMAMTRTDSSNMCSQLISKCLPLRMASQTGLRFSIKGSLLPRSNVMMSQLWVMRACTQYSVQRVWKIFQLVAFTARMSQAKGAWLWLRGCRLAGLSIVYVILCKTLRPGMLQSFLGGGCDSGGCTGCLGSVSWQFRATVEYPLTLILFSRCPMSIARSADSPRSQQALLLACSIPNTIITMNPVIKTQPAPTKLPSPHPQAAFNQLYIKVYLKHSHKALLKHDCLVIHAMTAAINKAVRLALAVMEEYPYMEQEVYTDSVPTVVKVEEGAEGQGEGYEVKERSAVHIVLRKSLKVVD